MQALYVYVLRSTITGRRYVGSTADLEDRLYRHNSGQSNATKHGAPWELIHFESYPTRAEAVRREMYYKTGKGRRELDLLMKQRTALAVPERKDVEVA